MDIDTQSRGDWLIISLGGRLDLGGAPRLDALVREELERGQRDFILDLGRLDYLSSAGLRSLLMLSRQSRAQQGRTLICGLAGLVLEVFQVSGFLDLFPVYPGLEEALAQG